jgi:hypothetical protein
MRRFFRWTSISLSILFILLLLVIWFSPYGYDEKYGYKLIKNSVTINVSCDSAFQYLGNSENASRWSVFVDHIIPLNADEKPDGSPGSLRRCFAEADEKGSRWDEEITIVEKNKRRQLTIFNMENFSVSAEGLATEQLYQPVNDNCCELTFTVFYKDQNPTFLEELKTYFAAYKIKSIFRNNMNNIKADLEGNL